MNPSEVLDQGNLGGGGNKIQHNVSSQSIGGADDVSEFKSSAFHFSAAKGKSDFSFLFSSVFYE